MRRRVKLLQSTLLIKYADMVEIVDDIWNIAKEFVHLAGTFMQREHIGNEDDLYLFQKTHESKYQAHGSVWTTFCANAELESA
jgi:hypothetical protein